MEQFLNELNREFTIEDFTGNLAVLLADESDFSDEETMQACKEESMQFIQKLYEIANKYMY